MKPPSHPSEQKNLMLALALSALLIVAWQIFIEGPRRAELARWNAAQEQQRQETLAKTQAPLAPPSREEILAASPHLGIKSPVVHGTLSLRGLRFDNLTLAKYHQEVTPDSPEVVLFSPPGGAYPYFLQIGWLSADGKTEVPGEDTLWQTDAETLTPEAPVTLAWENGDGVTFRVKVALDARYMFSVTQMVENASAREIKITPYALINRGYDDTGAHALYYHEGPLGVLDGKLTELSYKALRDEPKQTFESAGGWLGMTDKYWLSALIPGEERFNANFSHYQSREKDRYQVDYQGGVHSIPPSGSGQTSVRFFAGAKELETVLAYRDGTMGEAPVPLFDRAVDFGVLYFLTKPLFFTLAFLYKLIGNFGLALMALTVIVKTCVYPLASKSYRFSIAAKKLQPELAMLKEKYANDPAKFQKAYWEVYKRENVNPAAGCLPLIIQMVIFFSLFKVLFVTLEMRHAPFFGWLRDLSAPDPSNIFTLFGLVDWNPPALLHLGILPVLMATTMAIHMRLQPTPPDPTQVRVMKFMPWLTLIFVTKMPAGLVLYWTWSNILSIGQQWVMIWRHGDYKEIARSVHLS